jgi:DNA-binding NtrC family response regulator
MVSAKNNASVGEHSAKRLSIQVGATLREVEKRVIVATLGHCAGNLSRAAKILGINRSTLYEKIKAYKLKR